MSRMDGHQDSRRTQPTVQFCSDLVAAMPPLKRYAVSLCGNVEIANDLVQETMLKAWVAHASFRPGSNLTGWLARILRNTFYSEYRKRCREVEDPDGCFSKFRTVLPSQPGYMDLQDVRSALATLPKAQRDALLLVATSPVSYSEAGKILGCSSGTIKSRINRGRVAIAAALNARSADDLAPEPAIRAALEIKAH